MKDLITKIYISIQTEKFIREEKGLTVVEYAIAGGLIGAAVIGAFTTLGGTVGTQITDIDTALNAP